MLQRFLPALLLTTLPLSAQEWSVGVASGPFGFGRFAERTMIASTDLAETRSEIRLSAATRPGLSVDVQRRLSERFSIRLEGTFTESPVAVRDESDRGISLDAGRLNVGTFTLPLVIHINPRGTFRVHLLAGPAHAIYHVRRRGGGNGGLLLFEGTRSKWGAAGGTAITWRWNDRFAIEGAATDIVTSSPFNRSDFPRRTTGLHIPKPHNVHVTAGVRYAF